MRQFGLETRIWEPFAFIAMIFCCPCAIWYAIAEGVYREMQEKRKLAKPRKKAERAMKVRGQNEPQVYVPRPPIENKKPTLQLNSSMLCLPSELLEPIFMEILGGNTFHMIQLPRRLGHIRCCVISPNYKPFYWSSCFDNWSGCIWPMSPLYCYGASLNREPVSHSYLALLQTCRQIYIHAVHILYSRNTFEFNHPQTLLFLARTLPPQHFQNITHLQIYRQAPCTSNVKFPDDLVTWDEAWKAVGTRMKGLQHLNFIYEDFMDWWLVPKVMADLEEPRKWVRNLKSFEIRMPGKIEHLDQEMGQIMLAT